MKATQRRGSVCSALATALVLPFLVSAVSIAEPTEGAWNFERVGIATLPGGQLDLASFSKLSPWPYTDGDFLYSGCYDPSPLDSVHPAPDRCVMTVDVSDPLNPVRLATVPNFDPVDSPSPPPGHYVWAADYPHAAPPIRVPCKVNWEDPEIVSGRAPPPCWDPGWNSHNHYAQSGPGNILAANQERYRGGTARMPTYHGVKFFDISDRAKPRFLSYWEAPTSPPNPATGIYPDARGTHHFNFDGSYLYLGTEYEGYIGKILVILDVRDPENPVEAGKWSLPGQKTPEEDGIRDWVQQNSFSNPVVRSDDGKWTKHVGMHYPTVQDDIAYLSYHQAGLVILDVSDKSNPKLLSRSDYLLPGADDTNPDIAACQTAAGRDEAACGNTHAAKRIPNTDLLIVSDEYFTCPYGHVRLYDVADPRSPELLSHFTTDQNAACDPVRPLQSADPARFPRRGPSSHLGNPLNDDIYLMAWYGNGVQAIDISDPRNPKSAGYYNYRIDSDLDRRESQYAGSDTYDVIIGRDNYLFVSDGTSGLRVLRYTGAKN